MIFIDQPKIIRSKNMENYKYTENEIEERAQRLVSEMTIEEKCEQLKYDSPEIERLGIDKFNWWNECLHGVARGGTATVFPQAIALAAMFDEQAVSQAAEIIATEARAKYNQSKKRGDIDLYKGLTFWTPNINIFRDPRWGRGQETYGEDPYLTSRLGCAFVKGLQGDKLPYKATACAKHFAVHSGPEAQRHSFNAEVSEKELWETYLPAFKALITEAHAEGVMGAYNRLNGEPCCGSEYLNNLLRNEWKFDGYFVSDCWAIADFHVNHHVTKSAPESAALAIKNGCDLNCGNTYIHLINAYNEGLVSEEDIDRCVKRVIKTRIKLGMFDECTPYDSISFEEADSPEHNEFSRKCAEKSMVMLKNNGILPIKKSEVKTIAVIGPAADSRDVLKGNYFGTSSRYVTFLEGIREAFEPEVRVLYSEGCHLFKERVEPLALPGDRLSEALGAAECADIVILCTGLDATLEGEEGDTGNAYASGDKLDLRFPGLQNEVLEVAYESGKPVILLVLTGSAMDLAWADEHVNAIMQCWYPGAQGGNAIAQVLFGDACPEGRLPDTFYRTSEELPEFTDYSKEGRTYRYMKNKPLYPFGYGLSYTEFSLDNVKLSTQKVTPDGVEVTADVTNIGQMDGTQTVLVYVKAEREGTPNPQLKGIAKAALKKGETKTVHITLPEEAFGLCDDDGVKRVHKGSYTIYIGEKAAGTVVKD